MKYANMLEGRNALVLGGATPVGSAVARLFAAHGASVAVADSDNAKTRDVFTQLSAEFPGLLTFASEISPVAMPMLCARVLKELGSADILVSATDLYMLGHTDQFLDEDLRLMLEVNFFSAVRAFQAVLPGMLARRRGELVLIAPDLSSARPENAAAAACAGALAAFARNVSLDYIRYHVRANTVLYPFDGLYGSELAPDAPRPEDAANAALWLACDLSRFVVGETLPVGGGRAYTRGTGV